jgi:hypothetical protein
VTLDEWAELAAGELGVAAPDADARRMLLDAAREVAHHTMRPGAPLSTYLIGIAVGQGMPLPDAVRAVTQAAHRHGSPPPATS